MSAFGRKPTLIPLNFPCNAYQLEAMKNVMARKSILTGKEDLDGREVIVADKEGKCSGHRGSGRCRW